jgi:hypothetical protein
LPRPSAAARCDEVAKEPVRGPFQHVFNALLWDGFVVFCRDGVFTCAFKDVRTPDNGRIFPHPGVRTIGRSIRNRARSSRGGREEGRGSGQGGFAEPGAVIKGEHNGKWAATTKTLEMEHLRPMLCSQ